MNRRASASVSLAKLLQTVLVCSFLVADLTAFLTSLRWSPSRWISGWGVGCHRTNTASTSCRATTGWNRHCMTNSNTDSSTANTLYNEPRTPLDSPKNLVYQTIFKGLFVGSTVLSSSARASGPLSAGSFISKYGSEAIAQAVDQEVVKRATDDRIYKAFTLPNGLRALVVSDATASRAAAALDVNAGAFADPPEVPGIAHFCEHMLFLGTEKNPKEDSFSSYLSSHGGSSNAYTDSEATVYFFDVNADSLEGALDRFAQFFISPLFAESATARELNAIESEHSKNINSDGFRLYQLERDGANPAHPLNKFATGNKFTLETNAKAQGIDIREKLFEYYKQFYSANIMTLSVIGNQDVKTLEKWVRQRFADVPNRNAVAPNYAWWGKIAPYPSQKAAVALEIVPIGQLRSVSVSWPIWVRSPQERAAMLTAKPDVVVSHLLGHEGVGSLWSYLIKKGWGNEVQAAVGNEVSDMLMFDVSVDLTEEGFKHRYDVVKAIFAYIDLLKSRPIPSYIYSELEQLSYIGFNFAEKSEASSFASSLVENMQLFPTPKDYLVGPRLFNAPDPAQVGKLVDQLTPAAAMLKVISSDFEGKTKLKAKYYATNYNNITLERQTKEWERTSIGQYPELSLPPPNELIPTNFDLIVPPAQSEAAAIKALDIPPKIIRSDDRWTLWHKIDNSFKQPKAYVVLTLAVPQSLYDVDFVVNTKLFTYSFMDSINEYLYDARLAGLGFQLDFTSKGVQIVLSGYNDKLALFAERVCTALKTYEPDEPTYQRMRDLLLREYNSWTAQQPYFHASYFSALATETLNYPIPEMKAALARVSRASLKDFLTVSLGRSYGTAIAIGNLDEKAAIELTAIVEKSFPFAPLKRSERAIRQIVELPATGTLAEVALSGDSSTYDGLRISRQEPNQNDENSAVSVYYQMESPLPERYVLLELLADIIEQPFFNSLRTQQQLGYIVFCGVRNRERARYLTFTVQSSLIGGSEITDRILDFVRTNVLSALEKLPEEELAQFKQGIAAKKLEPDQRLTSHASRLWSEIVFANYYNPEEKANIPMFDRAKAEVAALNKINKKALIAFAKDFLLSANKRVLVTEVTSAKAPAAQARSPSEFVAISDEAKFQQESRKL